MVVTLPNRTYPLVRFATGDLSILSNDPCPCGRTSPRLLRLVGRVDQVTKVKGMFVHPEQVAQLAGKIEEIASAQFLVIRTDHDDRMEMRIVLKDPAAASDDLAVRIVEIARQITRLRGEVRFIAAAEVEEPEKKIIDKRKWD